MRRFHIVPERNEANGVYRVACLLAQEDGGEVSTCAEADAAVWSAGDEVWVHGMWLPGEWRACRRALGAGCSLVRMTHGSLSPVYLERQGRWKKRLAGPIERFFLRRADRVVATCDAEAEWIRAYEPGVKSIETTDIKRFFKLDGAANSASSFASVRSGGGPLHILYLGRRHPLKGVEFLEEAVRRLSAGGGEPVVELRVVSDAFGEAKERAWEWCDVLALPSLSENFGLVVAEALERGKRAIATDGAPAWADRGLECNGRDAMWRGRLTYIEGYRDGTDEVRTSLLEGAIRAIL